ncbi:MAG: M50 family metallopeptidase [Corynebacterium sp.]|nr:M50 family metallopeptidase [Corynebacterium sp.]
MASLLGILLFALGIAVTIALHEWGHLTAARSFGMRVRRYFIGFGPVLWSIKRGHTEYGIKAIPLGGFCDIAGMTGQDPITDEERPHAMVTKPWWQRIIVLLGGIIMNVLVAFCLLYGVAVSAGLPNPDVQPTTKIGAVSCVPETQTDADSLSECTGTGPAAAAGIQAGDEVVSLNGEEVNDFMTLRDLLLERPGETVTLEVIRGEKTLEIPVEVQRVQRLNAAGETIEVGAIGISMAPLENTTLEYNAASAIGGAASYTGYMFEATWEGLKSFPAKIPGVAASIFGQERDETSPMSVVGASRVGGELAEKNLWSIFFLMLANLNLFLAMFNLIPLPPLDGGHIAVVLYEKIRDFFRKLRGLEPGAPADYTKLMPLTLTVAALLLVVGVVTIVADVVNPIRLF